MNFFRDFRLMRQRFLIPVVIGTAFVAALIFQAFAAHFVDGESDFRSFYAAGYIVRTGHASQLYDYDLQRNIQQRVIGGDLVLPFLHPPHEAALFVPFSFLSYRSAYLLFGLVNLGLLALSYRLLQPKLCFSRHKWLPFAVFTTFLPVAASVLEGQDSVILLTLLLLATLRLERDDLLAGGLVGLGCFRFQLTLPIVLLFLLWKRWKFASGFAIAASLSFLASLVIVGSQGIGQYVHTLLTISVHLNSKNQMTRLAVFPVAMPNIRGLTYGLFGNLSSTSLLVITAVLSVIVIAIAAKSSFHTMAIAVTAAVLVSYHSMDHDLVLLLIPIFVALNAAERDLRACGLLVLVSPFFFVVALPYPYLTSIPILALLILLCRKRGTVQAVPYH
jgi:hypothetical protein